MSEDFVAVGFDTAGYIGPVTHCATKEYAVRYTAYYRRYYPSAKALTYDEFIALLEKEAEMRMCVNSVP